MEKKRQLLNSSLKQDKNFFEDLLDITLKPGKYFIPALCLALLAPGSVYSAPSNSAVIRQLQQKIIDNPKDVDSLLKLAIEYSVANNFVKAVETYFSILRVDQNNFHAYNNLGILYKQAGQFRDSLHCYQKAQTIDPDSCWVPYNMGLCYEAMGRMQEARESYGQALSLNPSFSQALQRLRFLSSDGADQPVPALPGLEESQIYIADSKSTKPVVFSQNNKIPVTPDVSKTKSAETKPSSATATKTEPKGEKISERLQKEKDKKKAPSLKHRTTRKGAAAVVFNQAMEALESGKKELAIELYVNSIIAERDLLSEPENGIIREGLKFLKDRPNRMNNGMFFRGILIYISGHLELAVADMKNYVAANENSAKASSIGQYLEEAKRIISRYEAEKAAAVALAAERAAAALAAKKAAEEAILASSTASANQSEVARPSDYVLKRMDTEQIIQEADRLSRESRFTDAIAVLEAGLNKEPGNISLLMKSANAYADMLLLKGDNEAGKMALSRYQKVVNAAPSGSKEQAVAKDMIAELSKRVR